MYVIDIDIYKHSSPVLGKILFQIMDTLIKINPNDTVCQFIDKKCVYIGQILLSLHNRKSQ